MPRKLKKGIVLSNDVLGWIAIAAGFVIAIVIDKRNQPHKWHAAIMWTVVAFYGIAIFGRIKWRSLLFWILWVVFLSLHIFAMWVIFAKLLPRLILGTLYVVPIAFVEAIFLLGIFIKIERVIMRLKGRQLHLKAK